MKLLGAALALLVLTSTADARGAERGYQHYYYHRCDCGYCSGAWRYLYPYTGVPADRINRGTQTCNGVGCQGEVK